jgi:hypothetical protein
MTYFIYKKYHPSDNWMEFISLKETKKRMLLEVFLQEHKFLQYRFGDTCVSYQVQPPNEFVCKHRIK